MGNDCRRFLLLPTDERCRSRPWSFSSSASRRWRRAAEAPQPDGRVHPRIPWRAPGRGARRGVTRVHGSRYPAHRGTRHSSSCASIALRVVAARAAAQRCTARPTQEVVTRVSSIRRQSRACARDVHPSDFARRGVGRLVLSLCESAAAERGFDCSRWSGPWPASRLYLACGFSIVERIQVPTSKGVMVPCARMVKAIRTTARVRMEGISPRRRSSCWLSQPLHRRDWRQQPASRNPRAEHPADSSRRSGLRRSQRLRSVTLLDAVARSTSRVRASASPSY